MSRIAFCLLLLAMVETLGFRVQLGANLHCTNKAVTRGPCRTTVVRAEDEVTDWGVDNLLGLMDEADEKIGGVDALLKQIRSDPKSVDFEQTMAAIEEGYNYSAVAFSCGAVESNAEQNQGSAKIFSFAKLNKMSEASTLHLFGRYYREDVLNFPDGEDHGNIRNFMKTGWDGVAFPDGLALTAK